MTNSMTRTAFIVILVAIVLTLGASMTVIVMTEQDKASAANSDRDSYKDQLLESQIAEQQAQTRLGLTREALDQTQSQLETARAELTGLKSAASTLGAQNLTCRRVGALTSHLLLAVRRQSHAVTNTMHGRNKVARKQLLRTARDLRLAERAVERSGSATTKTMIAKCARSVK